VQTSAGKVTASVFWDIEGILSVEFLEGGAEINSERYEFKTTFQFSAKQENESSLLPA
jgi:hypothetical protein